MRPIDSVVSSDLLSKQFFAGLPVRESSLASGGLWVTRDPTGPRPVNIPFVMQGVPPGALLRWIAERRRGLADKHDRAWRTGSHRDRGGGIRAWAKDQGIAAGGRGRIPASIIERYEAAGGAACS